MHAATSPSKPSSSSTFSTPPPPQPLSSPFLPFGSNATQSQNQIQKGKIVWVQPFTAEVAQAASEAGVRVLLFDEADAASAADFGTLARFDAVVRFGDGLLADVTGRTVGVAVELRTPADVRRAEGLAVASSPLSSSSSSSSKSDGHGGSSSSSSSSDWDCNDLESVVLADARDWAIIPAENLVAAFQEARRRTQASWEAAVRRRKSQEAKENGKGNGDDGDKSLSPLPKRPKPTPRLFVTASTADGAVTLLGALESGVDGVVLRTGDPREVRALCAAVEAASAEAAVRSKAFASCSSPSSSFAEEKNCSSGDNDNNIDFEVGVVSSVSPAGMGDRVCVDVTVLLEPGEGLLVGSFAAAALLVHSEREGAQGGNEKSSEAYISPRPFRVNAGAVHSYVAVPRGRTAYLSELEAGSEVLVVRPPMSTTTNGGGSVTSTTAATTATAVVGRAKVERRPMIKVDVRLADGSTCSAVLQNAETVRVVAPKFSSTTTATVGGSVSTAAGAAKPPRRRRLGAEDEEALRWVMDPSPPSASSSSSPTSSSSSRPEKLAVDAEKTLEWVMGPSASSSSNSSLPSSHPLSSTTSTSPPALSAVPTWSSTSSSSFDSEGADSDDAEEELVEGPPHRPYLLPRRHDSRAAAALRWLLNGGGGGGGKKASSPKSSSPSNSPAPSSSLSAFPSSRWDPSETGGWTTVAVTDLVPGQPLLVRRAAAARHTGIEIEESIVER